MLNHSQKLELRQEFDAKKFNTLNETKIYKLYKDIVNGISIFYYLYLTPNIELKRRLKQYGLCSECNQPPTDFN